VITADRPPEMRACASGQTIDQHRLYGGHVNFYHELAVPEASLPLLRYLRQTLAHAVERSLGPFGGPVHLNAPSATPWPVDDGGATEAFAAGVDWEGFFGHLAPPPPVVDGRSEVPVPSPMPRSTASSSPARRSPPTRRRTRRPSGRSPAGSAGRCWRTGSRPPATTPRRFPTW
jgi:2-succinyl-5-enolpyruvyl-6-hydroxy-3-cyclohexene-1-carboxylate synthase